MSFRTSLAACLVASAVAAPFALQQSPVFRSGVDLVTVDATVVDGKGQPIPGLGPEHFQLKVDGEPRRIVSVQYVSRGTAAAPQEDPGTPAAARVSSNEAMADGRLVLVAVDQNNIRRLEGRQGLQAAEKFIDELGSSDRSAVVAINYAGDIEFSRDHARAKRQLSALTGEYMPAMIQPTFNVGLAESLWIADGNKSRLEVAVRRECGASLGRINADSSPERAADTFNMRDPCPTQLEQEARATAQQVRTQSSLSISALEDMILRLKTIDGPKVVALLSEGLIAEPRLVDLTSLGAAAQEARVTLYVFKMEVPVFDVSTEKMSPSMLEDVQMREDGLVRLAGAAGGALFRLAGSDPAPFARVMREISGYYLLAFEASPADRDGKPHRIAVSVDKGGATLRSREVFRFEPVSWARRLTDSRIEDLLRSPAVASELPLRVASYSFYDPGTGKVRVDIAAETEPGYGETAAVLFAYVLLDSKGVIAATLAQETTSRRFTASASVAPGVYTLKIAALDRFGRAGSLPRAVLAGISDSPLPTSELMVARVPPDPGAALDPIVDRTSDERVVAHLELYPGASQSLREVDVTFLVRPATRAAVAITMPAVISTRGERHAIARASLPIHTLEPGRYVVRADVTDAGKPMGSVERVLTIER